MTQVASLSRLLKKTVCVGVFSFFFVQIRVEELLASKNTRASAFHRKKAPFSRSLFFSADIYHVQVYVDWFQILHYNSRHSKELSRQLVSEKKENVNSLRKKIEREAKQNIHNQFSQMDTALYVGKCFKSLPPFREARIFYRGIRVTSRKNWNNMGFPVYCSKSQWSRVTHGQRVALK